MNIEEYISSGIIESYVLGLADAQEAAELEQLKSMYPDIQAAIDSFEISLEEVAMNNAVTPSHDVKSKLMLALKDEFSQLDNSSTTASASHIHPLNQDPQVVSKPLKPYAQIHLFYKYVAIAASVLLIVSTSLDIYFYGKYNDANKQIVALLNDKNQLTTNQNLIQAKYSELNISLQLMNDSNITKVTMKGVAGKEGSLATVYWNTKTKDVYLFPNKLPTAPEGKQYQLWALVNGKPIDAGLLEECNGVCKLKNTEKADIFAITLENKGGSPVPNLAQLFVLGKVG